MKPNFCASGFTGNAAVLLFHTEKPFPPIQLESGGEGDNIEMIEIVKDWINPCDSQ